MRGQASYLSKENLLCRQMTKHTDFLREKDEASLCKNIKHWNLVQPKKEKQEIAKDGHDRNEHDDVSLFQGGPQGFQGYPVTREIKSLFLCYLLHTSSPSQTRLLPFGLQERNHSRQRKGSGFQGMNVMPKESACLWNTALLYQMTCWGCHMACM